MDTKTIETLIEAAKSARERAYAPYSHFQVGAALLTKNGKIFTGCNIENAAYTPTVCAERVAMFKAISEGETEFAGIAVVTENGVSPCGVCRQVLVEFMPEGVVIMATTDGSRVEQISMQDLLPRAFVPDDLNR